MSKHKSNPRNKPASQADVKKAEIRAMRQAIILTKVLVFTALLDEDIIAPENVKRGWEKASYLADSVNQGYCSIQDMYDTLITDYDVDLEG